MSDDVTVTIPADCEGIEVKFIPDEGPSKEQLSRALDAAEQKLERLGSSEAFDVAMSLNQERDAELIIRMDFARQALSEVQKIRGEK